MVFISLLPQGILQGFRAFADGYWHARTAEFMHSPIMELLVWLRVPGDVVFSFGAILFVAIVFMMAFARNVPVRRQDDVSSITDTES